MTGGGIERALRSAATKTVPAHVRWLSGPAKSGAHTSPFALPLRLSPPLAYRDASGDESLDASLQRAGGAIGAVVRLRRGYGRRLMAPSGHPIHH